MTSIRTNTKCVRREASSIGDLNQAITLNEWPTIEENRAGCKLDIFELGAVLECIIANSFEFVVADDVLEVCAVAKRHLFDDLELTRESDIR